MLRTMRMGDGMLARFNGMSIAVPAGLATVLAYDERPDAVPGSAKESGYVRVERGGTIVIMDVGGPPPLEHAGGAHAGCLSFEMSTGTQLLLINGGAPGPADANWRATARATASHNTLCLAEASSSRLIRHAGLEDLIGSAPIRGPTSTSVQLEEHGGNIELAASHNGYVGRYGLVHQRRLALNANGRRLLGIDTLSGQRSETRLRLDLPFAIHFHLHPDVVCQRAETPGLATLTLKGGETWTFSVEGAELTIEDSTYFADSAGPRRAMQLVARGATFGATEVRWVLECRT